MHLSAAADRNQRGYSWIEILLAIAIGLIIFRMMWDRGIAAQLGFLSSLCWLYIEYQDEARRLAGSGQPVVRSSVIVFAISSLAAALFYLFFFVG